MIDVHVHLAALPDGKNGCYISEKMLKGPLFRFLAWKMGLPIQDPNACNEKYFWVHNGPVLSNLRDLEKALNSMTDKQYLFHECFPSIEQRRPPIDGEREDDDGKPKPQHRFGAARRLRTDTV